jgi:dimethylargininase
MEGTALGASSFRHALVQTPGDSVVRGLTRLRLGTPNVARLREQHAAYRSALAQLGIAVHVAPADERFPDGTFVEDAAVVLPNAVMITRPRAESRRGETITVEARLREHMAEREFSRIESPGTVDGGDICVADEHVWIGLSHRTNEHGAEQMHTWLARNGRAAQVVDVRDIDAILHLKSGMSWLGENRVLVIPELAGHPAFARCDRIVVDAREGYAANVIGFGERVLIPSGYPNLQESLARRGLTSVPIAMSEFEKIDGGLTCLSLRW